MNIIEEILATIEKKNSWGKNELKEEVLKLLAKRYEKTIELDLPK